MPVQGKWRRYVGGGIAWLAVCLSVLVMLHSAEAADAPDQQSPSPAGTFTVLGSPGVLHFNSDPEHVDWSWLVGLQWQKPDTRWHLGYSYFNNSFGQKSHFYYAGYTWNLGEKYPDWYLRLSAGLIYGYKEPYENKVPLNHNGYSPGLFPALGYKRDRWNFQLVILGTAGMMATVGYDIIR